MQVYYSVQYCDVFIILEYLLVQKKKDTAQDKRPSNQYPSNNNQAVKK